MPQYLVPIALSLALLSCSSGRPSYSDNPNSPVGDMSDTSYFGARHKERVNAKGTPVTFDEFEGSFVWADYAAPWCKPCGPQAQVMKSLEGALGDEVVIVTVMTADMGGYGDPATQATAARWANKHGLAPERVLATDLSAIKIPRHLFFSPQGQLLYEKSGGLPASEILAMMKDRIKAWRRWEATGKFE